MEKEKAIKASEVLVKILQAEKRLEIFENTKEFCKIYFRGENGVEIEHQFSFEKGTPEIKLIRSFVFQLLEKQIVQLTDELNSL